ncbi:MAG TPA: tRNA (adenosine(37)-N6)-threonylcarbamoyltransferase complex dimerization subunit type 1 TsaB [Candidatus Binatia bacterium]|jgi:tRNA threonylcarbamoyl adenosine modification protein YeaZ|nr:tRNA (adenosine(37)-N6)-threonylcarbamoyltransferase complex dimerization subunit type 1 TsaB [Candidatus Binatia bacterium]
MKILALEFSSPQRSVAVTAPGAPAAEVVETGSSSTRALGMIDTALHQAQLEREQIDCLAIGLGPGSYNGIRTAIALAQGWQLARGVKLLGLSSAECLAAQAHGEGITGPVTVVIDAQRNELYLANYEISATGWREIKPLRLAILAEVQEDQKNRGTLVGPEVTKWFPSGRVIFPRAETLARLALGRTDFSPGEKIEPIYLRETKFLKAPPPRVVPS